MPYAKLILFLLLVTSSIFIHLSIDPYEAIGESLLGDGMEAWQVYGTGNVSRTEEAVTLSNDSPEQRTVLSRILPLDQQSRDFVFTVEASADGIQPGPDADKSGRLVIVSLRGEDQVPDYEIPSEVFKLTDTNDWQVYRMHIHAYPGVTALAVQLQLLDTVGRLSIRGLSLESAIENPYWPVIQAVMLSVFVAYLVWLFYPMLIHRPVDIFTAAGLFTVALIVLFTTMPMSLKNDIYSLFRELAPTLADVLSLSAEQGETLLADIPEVLVAKESKFFSVMHFLFFLTAAVLLFIGKSGKTHSQIFFYLVALAISTEAMQLFVMNRHGAIENALVDVAGILAGLAVVVLIQTTSNVLDRYRHE